MASDGIDRIKRAQLEAEQRGIYRVFTPGRPITDVDYFRGRQNEMVACYKAIRDAGRHVLIYGDRGVGKTSLADVACEEADHGNEFMLLKYRCDAATTFHSMWTQILNDAGFGGIQTNRTETRAEEGHAGLGWGGFGAGVKTEGITQRDFRMLQPTALTPAVVSQLIDRLLSKRPGLVILDELDRVTSDAERILIADLMKQLSDACSGTTLVLVGVAQTAGHLTAGHPSAQRSVAQVGLRCMSDDEVRAIVEEGGVACDIAFDENVVQQIVDLSAGYPHFAHLLGQNAAFHSVLERSYRVDFHVLRRSLQDAVREAEQSLKDDYTRATASVHTEGYDIIIRAISYINEVKFSKDQCREAIRTYTKAEVNETLLDNAITKFVADDGSAILHREGYGIYRFTDPRMPSYIRMIDQSPHGK